MSSQSQRQSQSQRDQRQETRPGTEGTKPTTQEELEQAPAAGNRGAADAYRKVEERNLPENPAVDHEATLEKPPTQPGSDSERF